jgi:processive 1,2-diacylglycerol beta-glucosyltransferase
MSEPAESSAGTQGGAPRYLLVIPGPEDRTGNAMAEAVREALLAAEPAAEVRLARLAELLPATARGVVTRARGALGKLVGAVRSAAGAAGVSSVVSALGLGEGGAAEAASGGDATGEAGAAGPGLGQMADAAMATFPLAASSLSEVRRLGLGALPILGLSSEERPDGAWARADLDAYAVIDEAAAEHLAGQGVDRARIAVTGLPVPRRWHHAARDRAELRLRHGIDPTHRVVIIDVHGVPLSSVTTVLLQLGLMQDRVDVLFATGQDRRMAEHLRAEARRLSIRARMFGEVERAEEVWALADVMVAEAMEVDWVRATVLRTPVVLLGELPAAGAARAAIDAALEHGAARRAATPMTLAAEVELLLRAERLDAARQALAPVAPENAASSIASRLAQLASHRQDVLEAARQRAEAREAAAAAAAAAPPPAEEPAPSAASASTGETAASSGASGTARPSSPLEDIGGPAEPGPGSEPHAQAQGAEPPHASTSAAGAATGGSASSSTASSSNPWSGPGRYAATNWERVVAAERAADDARRRLDTWDRRAALAREAGDMNLVRAASLEADRAREQLARALRELRLAEEGTAVPSAASSQDEETERRFRDLNVDRELEALKERMRGGGS